MQLSIFTPIQERAALMMAALMVRPILVAVAREPRAHEFLPEEVRKLVPGVARAFDGILGVCGVDPNSDAQQQAAMDAAQRECEKAFAPPVTD